MSKRVNFVMDDALHSWYKSTSETKGLTMSALMKIALSDYKDKVVMLDSIAKGELTDMADKIMQLKGEMEKLQK